MSASGDFMPPLYLDQNLVDLLDPVLTLRIQSVSKSYQLCLQDIKIRGLSRKYPAMCYKK